ncbi:MAG: hypothetical protein ACI837_003384 [Crocinitomicaceae bacterium]|jgi:hypothetical protein
MIARAASRPLWGVDPYLHFIVLGLSVVNILFLLPYLYVPEQLANFMLELSLSLVGILAFFLTWKKYFIGNILMLLWVLPQLVVIQRVVNYGFTSSFSFDLTQGFSFPFSFSSQSGGDSTSFGVNILAILLLVIALFRLKNRTIGRGLSINSIDLSDPVDISGSVINLLILPNRSQLLVLNYHSAEGMNYVIQTEVGDTLKFDDADQIYTLCALEKSWATQSTIKASQFTTLGTCKVSSL